MISPMFYQLSENSYRGFEGLKAALYRGSTGVKSNTASGLQLRLRQNSIGSRSSGKERDAETGLDYFAARYYSATLGRFASADPSPMGISLTDPQSWNRYAYVQNRALNYIDHNGYWATAVHGDIITIALQGYITSGMLTTLIERQAIMDSNVDWFGKEAYKHSMRGPGEDANSAHAMMNEFIGAKFRTHRVADFGDALHTIQDATSPWHTDNNFMPKEWGGVKQMAKVGLDHLLNETPDPRWTNEWTRLGLAVKWTMIAFMLWDPGTAKKGGLTPESFVEEYTKRISQYISSYYQGVGAGIERMELSPSQTFYYQNQNDRDADVARQCALGAPAACVQ
jgi:RHS repeat-associated protein